MSPPHNYLIFSRCLFLLLLLQLFPAFQADVGSAARYQPPYTPTACFGNDDGQFPPSNLFASAGEEIWDSGASCGRQYLVRCSGAAVPRTCIQGASIQIRIVDRALTSVSRPSRDATTIVLSNTAFRTIANASATSINIEFQQI